MSELEAKPTIISEDQRIAVRSEIGGSFSGFDDKVDNVFHSNNNLHGSPSTTELECPGIMNPRFLVGRSLNSRSRAVTRGSKRTSNVKENEGSIHRSDDQVSTENCSAKDEERDRDSGGVSSYGNKRSDEFCGTSPILEAKGFGISNTCFNCKKYGHRATECSAPQRECANCGDPNHRANECASWSKNGVQEPTKVTYVPVVDKMEEVFSMLKINAGDFFDKFFDASVQLVSRGQPVTIQPCKSFSDSDIPQSMRRNVERAGYTRTTPIQQYTLPLVADGKDILACAQTGSGKTAAFLLPIMSRLILEKDLNYGAEGGCYPRCIILTPTRELADQIYNEGRKFSYQSVMEIKPVYGGINVGYNKSQIMKGCTIIVGTIGRVKHFCEDGAIKLDKCRYLVLDEADRMIDSMGFGPEIEQIINYKNMPKNDKRQTMMFSATFPSSVQEAARKLLREDYTMITIDKIGAANKCVIQEFELCDRTSKVDKLLKLLGIDIDTYTTEKNSDVFVKKTIVFVAQQKMADTLASIMSAAQVPAITIHGAREQKERSAALKLFRSGAKPVLIATAVVERGLDIKGVDHVINYDMPNNIDDYIHRIGRTGRVGNSGRATSFISLADDVQILPQLVRTLADAEQVVPSWMKEAAGGTSNPNKFEKSIDTEEPEEAW